MKSLTASEWKTVLLWCLVWPCMSMIQFASSQDLRLGNDFVNLECERLPVKHCAFAVGAGGFRCVLETAIHVDGSITYECQTLRLELQAGRDANRYGLQLGSNGNPLYGNGYIETDTCIKACGLQRLTVGISTDNILTDNGLLSKLCSPKCQRNCANIIYHYGAIMAEAGEDFTRLCQDIMDYLRSDTPEQAKIHSSRTAVQKEYEYRTEQFPGPAPGPAPGPSRDWRP